MKLGLFLFVGALVSIAASAAPSPVLFGRVIERGANQKVVEVVRATTNQLGQAVQTTNRVTVLGQGMHFKDASGNFVESQPVIQSYAGGIVCTGASYSVILNQNLHWPGSVDLQASDGERVVSHPLAIYFYDPESGKSLLLAQLQDCKAEVNTNNEVIYRNAFAAVNNSGVQAAVTYRYEAGRFSQDVTLTTKPAITPADVGLGSKTRIEVASEIVSSPAIARTPHVWKTETNAVLRAAMAEPDVIDETISFGPELTMTLGRAFATAATVNRSATPGLPVCKRIVQTDGRTLLLESLEWNSAKSELEKLPTASETIMSTNLQVRVGRELPQMAAVQSGNSTSVSAQISFESRLRELSLSASATDTLMVANHSNQSSPAGFVMDYSTLMGSLWGITFASGNTYVIESWADIQYPTFEPGTVIKFARGANLYLRDTISFQSGGCPIVFTGIDDNTVGEPVVTHGEPYGYYAGYAMYCYYFSLPDSANNVDVRYASTGLYCYLTDFALDNSRFLNCGLGLVPDNCTISISSVVAMINTPTWWDDSAGTVAARYICEDCNPLMYPTLTANPQNVVVKMNAADPVNFHLSASGACNCPVTFALVPGHGPSHAQYFNLSPDGTVTYRPANNYESITGGSEGFDFTVSNCESVSQSAHANIYVNPVPQNLTVTCRPRWLMVRWDVSSGLRSSIADIVVQRAAGAGAFSTVKTIPIGNFSWTGGNCDWRFVDIGTQGGTTYRYRAAFQLVNPPTWYQELFSNEASSSTCGMEQCSTSEWSTYTADFWNSEGTVGVNNCYNYANNVRTDTHAQPGRASGNFWVDLSTDYFSFIIDSCISDGLIATTKQAPTPPGMTKLALFFIPHDPPTSNTHQTDFHFFRQDLDGSWSHKPGSGPATNEDYSSNPITDPDTADRYLYTEPGGYFFTCSSFYDGQGHLDIQ